MWRSGVETVMLGSWRRSGMDKMELRRWKEPDAAGSGENSGYVVGPQRGCGNAACGRAVYCGGGGGEDSEGDVDGVNGVEEI